MKKFLFLMCISFALYTGCARAVNHDYSNIVAGNEITIGIGDTFFEKEVMTGKKNVGDPNNSVFGGDAYRFELVVEAASNDQLKLGYSEYMKPPSPYGYYQDRAWLKKPSFSRTLEFDLKENKRVYYKSYEFEILNIQGGKITYKRIK
jgi:hypothetical protein